MKLITLFFLTVGGKSIGRLVNGIAVREIPTKGGETQQSIQLGHYGAGQWSARVGFLKKDEERGKFPPAVKSGKVFEATLVALPNTKKRTPEDPSIFYVLGLSKDDADTRILVRINTEGRYKEGAIGAYPKGEDELPHGWGKHTGPDGEGESFWHDGLVVMVPGDVLPVQPEGGAPEDVIGLYYDSKRGLCIVPVAEYQRLAALAAAKSAAVKPATPAVSAPSAEATPVVAGPAPEAKPASKKPKAKTTKVKTAPAAEQSAE